MALTRPPLRLLLLGGTREARELAGRLADDRRWSVISSLAGRTRAPEALVGDVRVGGFGGVDGLAGYLASNDVDIIIDATHPFAEAISQNAFNAARQTGRPYLRLCRPSWQPEAGDHWLPARDVQHAAALLEPGCKVLLTIGRQELAPFLQRSDIRIVARMIEAPSEAVPLHVEIILARPPFNVADEVALIRDRRFDVMVTKNAGGCSVEAKLTAARELGLSVIMIQRPPHAPPAAAQSVDDVCRLLDQHYAI